MENGYGNPAHFLGFDRDAMPARFLRAAGVDEAVVRGQVSDYDAFLALADALVLYEGHPRAVELNRMLRAETGVCAPLCPHTARAHWDAWVARHWYGREATGKDVCPTVCPHCAPVMTQILDRTEVMDMPAPEALVVAGDDLARWSERVCTCIPRDGKKLMVTLPIGYRFVKPDVYHAGGAVRAVQEGGAIEGEGYLLWTQMLRVLGGVLRQGNGVMVLGGGAAEDVVALLTYLKDAWCLPEMVWLCRESGDAMPRSVAAVSGLYAAVGTGLRIPPEVEDAAVERMRAAYAAVAPIGRCVVWRG